MDIIILLLGGLISGYLMRRLQIPGGMMLGSLIFSVIYVNFIGGTSHFGFDLGLVSQVFAGVCIGAKVSKEDLLSIRKIYKEILLISSSLLILSIMSGMILYYVFDLPPYDAFFGSIPGGMTSIPLIGMEYGANPVNVTILQFVRLIVGIGIFPKFLTKFLNLRVRQQVIDEEKKSDVVDINKRKNKDQWLKTVITLLITFIMVIILEGLNLPIGTLVTAILVSALFNIMTGKAYIREEIYGLAQLLLGVYIGSVVRVGELPTLDVLILPVLSVAVIFGVGCFIIGTLVNKITKFSPIESYFSAIPAGAADLGLITHELGVFSSVIVVVQVARVLIVTSIFPPIMNFIVQLL